MIGAEEKLPVFEAVAAANSLPANRIHKGNKIREVQSLVDARLVVRKEFQHAIVISARLINSRKDFLVSIQKEIAIHSRHVVQIVDRVASRSFGEQSSFLQKPAG